MTLLKTFSTEQRFSRRALLQGLGVSAAFLPLVHAERALAASATGFPKRLVTAAWTNGVAQSMFYPTTDSDPSSSVILAPFAPIKSKVLLAAGLDYQVMVAGHRWDGHFSYPVMYTGAYKNTGGQNCTSDGASIDQLVSDAIAAQVSLPQPLLNITLNGQSTSFRGPGDRNTGENSPTRLFNSLFASSKLGSSQVGSARDQQKSVLDLVLSELTGFKSRMGTDDRAKIDAHLDAVRQLELRLAAAPAVCTAPTTNTSSSAYEDQVKAMMDMTAMALRCDLTRAVSIVLGADGGSSPGSFPFLGITSDYHGIAHQGSAAYAQKSQIDRWYYQQIANLATQLDSATEGTGTALDNSVIVVGQDMCEGASHSIAGMQFLLVGSCGGYFKTGRVVKLGAWAGRTGNYWQGDSGVAHNQLLASLGNAMGVPMTAVGSIAGTLDQLTK